MTEHKSDIFVANKSYPDAKGIFFDGFQSLSQVRQTCVVILDTNALLVPYGISKNTLSQIEATYTPLADGKRLIVPGQVAREFARNRPTKISNIFQALSRKRNFSTPEKGRYPLLEDAEEYKKLQAIEEELDSVITEYRSSIAQLLDHIRNWHWNDPVSRLYSRLFPELIVDPPLDESCVLKQLEYQHANKLPPGYKDASKDDCGIGDQLVWNAVVMVAKERKCPIVLVSDDAKADWFYRSEGQPLFPRYELVDEVRRATDGKSLHIVPFSDFLELFGANAEAVGEVRKEEVKINLSNMSRHGQLVVTSHLAEQAVIKWLKLRYPFLDVGISERYQGLVWSDPGGASTLIDVRVFSSKAKTSSINRVLHAVSQLESVLSEESCPFDNGLLFAVYDSSEVFTKALERLYSRFSKGSGNGVDVVFATTLPDGEVDVEDPFEVLPSL